MSVKITKPMLAETADEVSDIPLPCLASYKLDGIRCIKVDGKALSRSFKPIPNHYIRNWIEANLPDGIDGEIMLRGENDFNTIQSAIMGRDDEPDFVFHAFDLVQGHLETPFNTRTQNLIHYFKTAPQDVQHRLVVVNQEFIDNLEDLHKFELEAFEAGAEGIMTRQPSGPYKCNRSTLKEAFLLKYKRWVDEEGEIIGFNEAMKNNNEKETNELGDTKRSTKKSGLVPSNTLGTFIVKRLKDGSTIKVGTGLGMTKKLKQEIWDNQAAYVGKLIRFKHQVSPNDPSDLEPRFPSFQGFRHPDDMST